MAIYIPQPDNAVPQNPPKFFKIVTDPEADALSIPVEFTKRFGQDLPDHVFLKAPGGSSWCVDVIIKSNGESCLHHGWPDFRDHYAIRFGHLVEFAYDGVSRFDVSIFDMTTTEIKYNMYNANNTSSRLLTQRELPKLSNKKRGTTAYEAAQAFKAKNISPQTLSFVSLLQLSNTKPRYQLRIPTPVVRKINYSGQHVVELRGSSGKTWLVKSSFRPERGYTISGWKEFVEDNALKFGDACVIEVNERNKLVWTVTIFKN